MSTLKEALNDPNTHNAKRKEQREQGEIDRILEEQELLEIERFIIDSGPKTEIETVIVDDDLSLRVRTTMDGHTERLFFKVDNVQKRINKQMTFDGDSFIGDLTELLARFCVDAPYDTKSAWSKVYNAFGMEATGHIMEIVMGPYRDRMQKVKKFRPESKRNGFRAVSYTHLTLPTILLV